MSQDAENQLFLGGWIPDLPDARDKLFFTRRDDTQELPKRHLLDIPWVYDQGRLGSCTANAVSNLYQYREAQQDGSAPPPSRLGLYYWTRLDQGTVHYDSGASIRGAVKAIARHGICEEHLWQYKVDKFREPPNHNAERVCAEHKLKDREYARVDRYSLRGALLEDQPIAFGFSVYDSFVSREVARTGMVPMPDTSRERVLGGHAMTIIGYDNDKRLFTVRNSWGRHWGYYGQCYMPYDFIEDPRFSSDFWTIYEVEPLS